MKVRGLFIENNDSFSFNVIGLLPVEREALRVVSAAQALSLLDDVDFVVIGPGPMDPERAGLVQLVREAAARRLPTLGICLGHQAIGLAFGGTLVRSVPVHGEVGHLELSASRCLAGLEGGFEVMRYHSLSLDASSIRSPLRIIGSLSDGTVMALEHESLPMLGLQFHPDSYATPRGRTLVDRFFERCVGVSRNVTKPATRAAVVSSLDEIEPSELLLSSLRNESNFALLGPGYTTHGHWELLRNLTPAGGDLVVIEAEQRVPTWWSGARARVTPRFDVEAVRCDAQLDVDAYLEGIEHIRAAIASGDVYQVNLTQRIALGIVDPAALLATLCRRGVPRFAAWVKADGLGECVSASPELLVQVDGRDIRAEPMKGTAAPSERARLERSTKDAAELAMIADLVRDDLHHLCEPASVEVENPRRFIELPYALQTVCDVHGVLREETAHFDTVLAHVHPGGSVTGAPRSAALEMIARLESSPRRFYCGTLGLATGDSLRAALLIRTAFRDATGGFVYGVGGGITWPSRAEEEVAELMVKLGALR